jgi:hypothetical protein
LILATPLGNAQDAGMLWRPKRGITSNAQDVD